MPFVLSKANRMPSSRVCVYKKHSGKFRGDLFRYSFHRIFTVSAHLSICLTENTTIPNINEVKENMTMGTTLVVNPDGNGFLVGNICGWVCLLFLQPLLNNSKSLHNKKPISGRKWMDG